MQREKDHQGADCEALMVLYLRTTTDEYELPIAVADTAKELAEELGVTEGTVYTQISKKRRGWYKVSCEAEDRNEDIR